MEIPSSRSSRASVTIASAARRSGSRFGDLRADVDVQADDLQSVAPDRAAADVAHGVQRDAELVGLRPGRNVRVAAGVDVGVHAQRDARARLPLARQEVDALELPFRLGVDRLDAEVDRLRELRRASCRRR